MSAKQWLREGGRATNISSRKVDEYQTKAHCAYRISWLSDCEQVNSGWSFA
jgi:hypothetical protein